MRIIIAAAVTLIVLGLVALSAGTAVAAEKPTAEWDPSLDIPGVSQETAAEYESDIAPPSQLKSNSVLDDLPDRVLLAAPPIAHIRLRGRPGPDGRCNEFEIVSSSGFPEIDQAAIRACRLEYSWGPSIDGSAPNEWHDVEINFRFTQ